MKAAARIALIFVLALVILLSACTVDPATVWNGIYATITQLEVDGRAAQTTSAVADGYRAAGTDSALAGQMRATQNAEQATRYAAEVTRAAEQRALATQVARSTAGAWELTAQAAQTEAYWQGEAQARTATVEMARANAQVTAVAAQAEIAAQAAIRERNTNTVRAWAPWAVGAALMIFGLAVAYNIGSAEADRRRWIPRDARGDAPIYSGANGDVYDPDRNPGALARLPRPALAARALQAVGLLGTGPTSSARELTDPAVTARDQMVDATTRGLPSGSGQAGGRKQLPATTQQTMAYQPRIRIYKPGERPAQLPAETEEVLEAEWREANSD